MKPNRSIVITGLEAVAGKLPSQLRGKRAAILVHPASVNQKLAHAVDVLRKSPETKIGALFGPQHGIRGETQDNMIEWEGFQDRKTGLTIYSLYGRTRKPEHRMLEETDYFILDLQDVGARYYTFIWTMALCMEACREMQKPVVVLDRPNPIGGHLIEGPVLDDTYASFVGLRPLPVRHGMTIGEIALYIRDAFYPSLELHVIQMEGWQRKMWFDETRLPWVMPSPNMPTLDTATVYPGMCLLEATNISEGRGTTRPFEIFGASFIEADKLVEHLQTFNLPGVIFRAMSFQPTFHKFAGEVCGGAQIHVSDREKFRPFKTGVAILNAIHDLYPAGFAWKEPPYEYEFEKMPIDILAGTDRLRKELERGERLDRMEEWWMEECSEFDRKVRKKYLLY